MSNLIICTLVYGLFIYSQTNAQMMMNNTIASIMPYTSISATIFETKDYQYEIDIEIFVNYSFFINSTNNNINYIQITNNILTLINIDLTDEYTRNSLISNDTLLNTININININTNNEDDLNIIMDYEDDFNFESSVTEIIEENGNNLIVNYIEINVDYIDNNEYDNINLNWFNPLEYTPVQWLIVGGGLAIIICIVVVCSIYFCVCNKTTKKTGNDPIRYNSGLHKDGIHSFNNRSGIQLGTNTLQHVQYVD